MKQTSCYNEVGDNMNLGKRITELRKRKNLTQQELADQLFVTDKTISSWESNRTEPNLEILMQLSEILDCSMSYLMYGDINKSDVETEIKIKLTEEEYQRLESYMQVHASFLKETKQVDTYYEPTYRKFTNHDPITEWLRIGERGNKKILNYKNWYDIHCDEYEVEIDDSKNLAKIFHILGLTEIAVVDKLRKTYLYQNKYEVALDIVKDLGYFMEIEVKKYDTSIMEEYDDLLKLAKNLDLSLDQIDKRGYPYYFIEQK